MVKKLLLACYAALILCPAVPTFAQDSPEPSKSPTPFIVVD